MEQYYNVGDLPPTAERTWYLKTSLYYSLANRNATPKNKEQILIEQVKSRNQSLVVRLSGYKKVTIPVVVSGRAKTEDEFIDSIEKRFPDTDEYDEIIADAYDEWLEIYNRYNRNSESQPVHALADINTISNVNLAQVDATSNFIENNSKLPSAKPLEIPMAFRERGGKKMKTKIKKSKLKKTKKTRKNK
jgi:hypothetical protein